MQQALLPTFGLICRLWLAVFFAAHVAAQLLPGSGAVVHGHEIFTGSAALDAGVALLMGLVALWLVLGVCSRIVAMLGIVLCTVAAALYGDPVFTPERTLALLAVAVLAVTGGGRLRLRAWGWRLRGAV